jgi:hypothetical protein
MAHLAFGEGLSCEGFAGDDNVMFIYGGSFTRYRL